MTHTEASLLGIAVTVVLDLWVLRTRLLTRRAYWVAYAIVLFFQLITNEWLTSRGVFDYDDDAILGWRIGHAPIEDFWFGFALVTQSMAWWVWWGRRGVQRQAGPGPRPVVARLLVTRRARRSPR
ncbi:lycopene cyclase domain-containing protein [Nocardioides sp. 1609]|uniref:lycopene cyclase domain-containing protein n=1 Tax=Nocardioides sp. 1609 TaxID=2508327 RepID=UPI00107028BA|nr:lycopene cyclase domain-containing protein [Nocardioides sp. 1609]